MITQDQPNLINVLAERLSKIRDRQEQVDIIQYFKTINFMSKKVKSSILFDLVNSCYYDLTVSEFISLNEQQVNKRLGKTLECDNFNRFIALKFLTHTLDYMNAHYYILEREEILEKLNENDNVDKMFVDSILLLIMCNKKFLDAGISLFYDDIEVQEAAKQYKKTNLL